MSGQIWSEKVGFGQIYLGLREICEEFCEKKWPFGQKKWPFAHF